MDNTANSNLSKLTSPKNILNHKTVQKVISPMNQYETSFEPSFGSHHVAENVQQRKADSEMKHASKVILRSNYITSIPKIINPLDFVNKIEKSVPISSPKGATRSTLPFSNGKKMRLFSAGDNKEPESSYAKVSSPSVLSTKSPKANRPLSLIKFAHMKHSSEVPYEIKPKLKRTNYKLNIIIGGPNPIGNGPLSDRNANQKTKVRIEKIPIDSQGNSVASCSINGSLPCKSVMESSKMSGISKILKVYKKQIMDTKAHENQVPQTTSNIRTGSINLKNELLLKASEKAPKNAESNNKFTNLIQKESKDVLNTGKATQSMTFTQMSKSKNNVEQIGSILGPQLSTELEIMVSSIKEFFYRSKERIQFSTKLDFYRIGKLLGKGAFGRVNLGMHKLSGKFVAIKSINKKYMIDEDAHRKVMREVSILKQLRHPNVMRLYETFESENHILFVTELCTGGDLLNYVRKRRKLKECVAKVAMKQILDGLHHIHSKSILHRDIKLDNILLTSSGEIKICDFGVSKVMVKGRKIKEQCGTPAYIAPEILKDEGYDGFEVDIWSAGVVLYAMLYGTVPFKATNMEELHRLILKGTYSLGEEISDEAKNLLSHILEIDPKKRFKISEILSHKWFDEYDDSCMILTRQTTK